MTTRKVNPVFHPDSAISNLVACAKNAVGPLNAATVAYLHASEKSPNAIASGGTGNVAAPDDRVDDGLRSSAVDTAEPIKAEGVEPLEVNESDEQADRPAGISVDSLSPKREAPSAPSTDDRAALVERVIEAAAKVAGDYGGRHFAALMKASTEDDKHTHGVKTAAAMNITASIRALDRAALLEPKP